MHTQNIAKMTIKTVSTLLKENICISNILDLILQTEEQSFVKELQETREVYEKRITIFPDYVFLFFDDENNYFGYFCAEFLEEVPNSFEKIAFNHTPRSKNFENGILYISSFAINLSHRKLHLGKKVFYSIFELLQKDEKIKKIVLLVNEKWSGAINIYKSCGFSLIKTFSKVFPPEEPSLEKSDGLFMMIEK